jgi:hypothetical protein
LQARQRPARELHRRTTGRQIYDAHVAPEHASAESGAERLGARLLRGEPFGISFAPPGAPLGSRPLDGRENARDESVAVPIEGALNATDIDQIGADANYHARPRSIAARIAITASRKPP